VEMSAPLWVACTAYLVGTASPGPSNLAIMGVAMQHGRRAALATAAGVVVGSLTWGLLAAFGLASALALWSGALAWLKVAGGLYLLWLAAKATRSALAPQHAGAASLGAPVGASGSPGSPLFLHLFARGCAMHLTNPKAIFVWLSIVAMALPLSAQAVDSLRVVAACACIGIAVFGGYALAFSTATARRVYERLRRWLEASFALMFGYAGVRMLLSKDATF
jgi:threonine efflux protein